MIKVVNVYFFVLNLFNSTDFTRFIDHFSPKFGSRKTVVVVTRIR